MSNIIDLEQRRSEREQRRISPLLAQAAKLRQTAHALMIAAEVLEMEAYGMVDCDYDAMADEKVSNLEAMRNA